jgi:hypothetical protein
MYVLGYSEHLNTIPQYFGTRLLLEDGLLKQYYLAIYNFVRCSQHLTLLIIFEDE